MKVSFRHSSPSYKQGFARLAGESANSELWNGFAGAWVPNLGRPTANTVHDIIAKKDGTLTGGAAFDFDGSKGYVVNTVAASSEHIQTTNDTWQTGGDYSFAVGCRMDSTKGGGDEATIISNYSGAGSFNLFSYTGLTLSQDGSTYHHWFCTLTGLTLEVWLDGVSLGTNTISAAFNRRMLFRVEGSSILEVLPGSSVSKGQLRIGHSQHAGGDYFDGAFLYTYMWEGVAHTEEIVKQIHRDHLAPFRRRARFISYPEFVTVRTEGAPVSLTQRSRPSYKQGFARFAGDSAFPNLRKDLEYAGVPAMGPTGETLFDVSGRKRNGTLKDMDLAGDWLIGNNQRLPGYGLDFAGTDDFVDMGDTLDALSDSMSILFWLKTTQTTTLRIVQKRGGGAFGAQAGWQISWNTSVEWGNTFWDDGATNYVAVAANFDPTVRDGLWHHMVFVWDAVAESITVYVDGVDQLAGNTGPGGLGSISTTRNLTLGCSWNDVSTQSQFYIGELNAVLIYKRVLLPNEVRKLYDDSLAPFRRRRVFGLVSVPPPPALISKSLFINQAINRAATY